MKQRREWTVDGSLARRRALYERAAPVFQMHGYRGTTMKALAAACGLSIPGLYRYFPSKKAFALYPLVALYPELHGPPPDITLRDPATRLREWIEAAATEAPRYTLAARLLSEVKLAEDERRRMEAQLQWHIEVVARLARRAAPHLGDSAARDLASTMINVALGPAVTGLTPDASDLRRELRALLRGYGVAID